MNASISKIKLYKACRKAYYFRYVENLESVNVSDVLVTGRSYHIRIQALYEGEELPADFSKDAAMAEAYKKYIMPNLHMAECEKWLEKPLANHMLHGRIDGLTDDGVVVEHKTTSRDVRQGGEYEYNLLWDEQVLMYLYLTGTNKLIYTVIRKPTIRQKKEETEEEFYQRMIDWYDEDTEDKIRIFEVTRTDSEIKNFETDMFQVLEEMDNASALYRNTCNCNSFGSRCEYSDICLNYNPNENYINYVRKE